MGSARDTRLKTREISSVKFLTKNIIIISHCHLSCFYSNDIAFCQAQWKRVHRVTEISGFKVEKKDSLDSIPSPSVKIQIIGGKVYLR